MKILHIIDSEGLYGAEVMLLNLVAEQVKLGHQPVIASIREMHEVEMSLESEANRRGLESVTFRMHDGPNIPGALRMLRFAQTNGFQILHTHGYKGNILFGFIPKRIRQIPLVCTLHGWTSTPGFSKLRLYEYIDALSLRFMDAICVVNQVMFERLRSKNLQCQINIIPNGIQLLIDSNPISEDEITDFCQKGFTIVSIGRLSKEKGHEYLIEAFDQFSKKVTEGKLLIIGEGPEREALENMIRDRGLSGKVLLPGYRDQAWRYLHNCRVFVLSSLTEGLPITLLEAMQVGVPVITTAVGGIPQVIKSSITGRLVPSKDPMLLSESIFETYNENKEALEMAVRAKNVVLSEYSSHQMAQRYSELYQSILN
jgi:glycosyltransferase involved in cell wall biosynthesis